VSHKVGKVSRPPAKGARSQFHEYERKPRVAEDPSSEDDRPVWRLGRMARDGGRWCWDARDAETWEIVTTFLGEQEARTWAELCKAGAHTTATGIPVESLPAATLKRLEQHVKRAQWPDLLWELHINGKRRIWGERRRRLFEIIWWDAEHEVYPSKLRRT
jgi:hypothetical protein